MNLSDLVYVVRCCNKDSFSMETSMLVLLFLISAFDAKVHDFLSFLNSFFYHFSIQSLSQ